MEFIESLNSMNCFLNEIKENFIQKKYYIFGNFCVKCVTNDYDGIVLLTILRGLRDYNIILGEGFWYRISMAKKDVCISTRPPKNVKIWSLKNIKIELKRQLVQ